MRRPLLATGLALLAAGQSYWTWVSLSFATGLDLPVALTLVSITGLLVGLLAVQRGRPGGVVLGFGLAAVAELVSFAASGPTELAWALPPAITVAGFIVVTWNALATDGVPPRVVARRIGAGLLVAGIGGVGWLYGNLSDPSGNPIWIPGSLLVGVGAGIAFWELRRSPVDRLDDTALATTAPNA